MNDSNPTTTTISVFTRHTPDCTKREDRTWKRCNCRKALYIYENGHDKIVSARTRSWEQAERVAEAERDKRNPVKLKLREIEAEAAAIKADSITISDALARWISGLKIGNDGTAKIYGSFSRKVETWAASQGLTHLHQITGNSLDSWRGQWSPSAPLKLNRMSPTTQSQFQARLKSFCGWATSIDLLRADPTRALRYIKPDGVRTQVLTPAQFTAVLDEVAPFIAGQVGTYQNITAEFRALVLTQRWTGLRIGDVLTLKRSSIHGNRIARNTQKTHADFDRVIPDCVVEALASLSPKRPSYRPDHYLWPVHNDERQMKRYWDTLIHKFSICLALVDDHGQPMKFHSHMLRDTFAVEMLLAGVALEDVSRLLTHKSINTTEKFYAPWVRSRRNQLEEKSVAAMRLMGVTVSMDAAKSL